MLYKLTYEPRYNVVVNNPTVDSILITDRSRDLQITAEYGADDDPVAPRIALATRPEPYIASGELEDCQPPGQYSQLLFNGRIFLITGSRREIWYSKDLKENPGIAPGFSPLQVEIYERDLTALAGLADKRIVFHATGLWFIQGDGPNVSGTDNRFSTPQVIQSDVGCTNPRSVLSWPGGVCFQSGADLYNLGPDLSVSWFGRDVRDTLAAFPTITSAVLVADQNEIRWTCNNAADTAGIVLVFDYVRSTWTTRTYPGSTPLRDAVLHEGVYYFAPPGEVRYEDTTTHLDDVRTLVLPEDEEDDPSVVDVPTFVASTVELAPISPAGIGWQRVRIAKMLGQSLSNHSMTMTVARDFDESYEQTEAFAAGSAVTTPSAHARAEVALTVQRRQAVQLKFVDAAPSNTTAYPLSNGAGFQLEGVALLVQPKQGLPRDTSSRRGG